MDTFMDISTVGAYQHQPNDAVDQKNEADDITTQEIASRYWMGKGWMFRQSLQLGLVLPQYLGPQHFSRRTQFSLVLEFFQVLQRSQ